MSHKDIFKYMKSLLIVWVVSLTFFLPNSGYSQSLREFFSNRIELNRDDLPETVNRFEELSFNEVICEDKELFPKKIYLRI